METSFILIWPWAIPLAFALDLLLGDPLWLPHPVRAIGAWANLCEKVVRRILGGGVIAGSIFWFCVVVPATLIPWALVWGANHLHEWLARALQVWLIYQGLALRDLIREVRNIYKHLIDHDLPGARAATARIVSRSTDGMDEAAICRSAIESASENGVDGVLSPLFWTALLGPAGLWAFKAASTLDSMVGYRTPKYERFGKISARMDDLLNWLPARLSLFLYSLATLPNIKAALRALRIGWRDHRKHASPNSGYSEATLAGSLGKRLGGPAVYHGILKSKPWFGAEFPDATPQDIPRTIHLLVRASGLALILYILLLDPCSPVK